MLGVGRALVRAAGPGVDSFRPCFCGGGERDVPHVPEIGPVVAGKNGWIWVFLGAGSGGKSAIYESLNMKI